MSGHFRSPLKLRSGSKGNPVLLSSADKLNVETPSTAPACSSSATAKTTTMPPVNFDNIDPALLAAVRSVVETAVKTAVEAAMATFHDALNKLKEEVGKLQNQLKEVDGKLAEKTDELEQYQRRNNIRLFGLEETAGEDTDQLVIRLCHDKLGVELPADAISRSHRVGKHLSGAAAEDGRTRHRPIIVRFATYRARRQVYGAKKNLKGTGVVIREDLTSCRRELYQRAVNQHGVKNVWTHDGRVLWVDSKGKKGMATRLADLAASPQDKN